MENKYILWLSDLSGDFGVIWGSSLDIDGRGPNHRSPVVLVFTLMSQGKPQPQKPSAGQRFPLRWC